MTVRRDAAYSALRSRKLAISISAWQERFAKPRYDRFNYAYGDTSVIARFVGLPKAPSRLNGEWQHGVVVRERNKNADWIIGSDGLSHQRPHKRYYVARGDQVLALKAFGFTDIHAIGLPFAYVTPPPYERVPNTLLVMPAHGLPESGSRIDSDYADFVAGQRKHFSDVVVCLHRTDHECKKMRALYEDRGLLVVRGADPEDANAYDRIASLFSYFDVVTGNDFGSHVAYAALTGAKVSVAGPQPPFDRSYYLKLPYYRNCPAVLDLAEELVVSRILERNYPFLYADPKSAQPCKGWAADQIGVGNRRSPEELRRLFGWTPSQLLVQKWRDRIGGIWDCAWSAVKPPA